MRWDVCYNSLRMDSIRLIWLNALKEGFNVRNGNSLKAFGNQEERDLRKSVFAG